jgi:hypothetical protein
VPAIGLSFCPTVALQQDVNFDFRSFLRAQDDVRPLPRWLTARRFRTLDELNA